MTVAVIFGVNFKLWQSESWNAGLLLEAAPRVLVRVAVCGKGAQLVGFNANPGRSISTSTRRRRTWTPSVCPSGPVASRILGNASETSVYIPRPRVHA